jgi:hypothetical protein
MHRAPVLACTNRGWFFLSSSGCLKCIFSQSRAERGFEFIKQTEGNWEFVPLLRNFLNLFRNISNRFKIDNASTIALQPILKI